MPWEFNLNHNFDYGGKADLNASKCLPLPR